MKSVDDKFKNLNLSQEELSDFKREKHIKREIKATEEEKTKIEEQLKRIEQF
jgi:hypothetical protein